LARRLGVSEALVGLIADDLARRGYLAPLETGCSAACNGCGLASACVAPSSGRAPTPLLALTAKGRLAIDRITPS